MKSHCLIESVLGEILLKAQCGALTGLYFKDTLKDAKNLSDYEYDDTLPVFRLTAFELKEYFEGRLTEFSVPLKLQGTAFQLKVWAELSKIPCGKSVSYKELAAAIGQETAVRAVGRANAMNPLSIIVPCHRVIAANGAVCGYAGGVGRKAHLLALEAAAMRSSA